jgi:ribonuclease J
VRDAGIDTNPVFVDGLGVGDVREVVMRDRISLAEDGMFVIVIVVNRKTGKLVQDPDIISRGFIYLRESGHLVAQAQKQVREIVESSSKSKPIDDKYIRDNIKEELGNFFFKKTERRPMILPMIIEV